MRLHYSFLAALLLCGFAVASDDVRSTPLSIEVSTDAVTASGRWVTGQSLDVPLLGKLNTANITCSKQTMSCTEAVAALVTSEDHSRLTGQLLLSVLSHYVVDSWTASEIIAKSQKRVADLTLRIDLSAGSASRRYQETKARGSQSADSAFKVDWQLR